MLKEGSEEVVLKAKLMSIKQVAADGVGVMS